MAVAKRREVDRMIRVPLWMLVCKLSDMVDYPRRDQLRMSRINDDRVSITSFRLQLTIREGLIDEQPEAGGDAR